MTSVCKSIDDNVLNMPQSKLQEFYKRKNELVTLEQK